MPLRDTLPDSTKIFRTSARHRRAIECRDAARARRAPAVTSATHDLAVEDEVERVAVDG